MEAQKTQIMASALIVLFSLFADAATIRLPTRYIITEYTVHRLTGMTSGEVTKERTRDSPLEILPDTADGESYLQFRAPAGTGIDRSDEIVELLPMSKLAEMVEALESIPKRCNAARLKLKPEDSEELIFEHGDISITFITKILRRSTYADFNVGGRQFVLRADKAIETLADTIASFKP